MLLRKSRVPIKVVAQDLHAKSACARGNFLADATQPGNANGLANEFVAREALPFSRVNGSRLLHEIAVNRKEESEGVLGHSGVVHAGTKGHRYF